MFKKFMAYVTAFSLVVAGITYAPKITSAAVTSANGHGSWSLVWSDEFDQTIGGGVDTNIWNYDIGNGPFNDGWGNNERQYYTNSTENVYIADLSRDSGSSDGKGLAIKCIKNGSSITSGRIHSQDKLYMKYGRIESKLRVEKGMQSGVWPAFWMLGNNYSTKTSNQNGVNGATAWPGSGEIDIMEHRNAETHTLGTIHFNPSNNGQDHQYIGSEAGGSFADIDSIESWHTYAIDWYSDVINFYVDGVRYQSLNVTSAQMDEFQREYFLLFNLAIGSNNSPFTMGQTIDSNFTDATMYVDYVRVYQGTDGDFAINKKGTHAENVTIPEEVTKPYTTISGKYAYKDNINTSVVNIQNPDFATEDGIYVTTNEGITNVTINGVAATSSQYGVQGSGTVIYLSALKSYNNVVRLYNGSRELGSVNLLNQNYAEEGVQETTTTTVATDPVEPGEGRELLKNTAFTDASNWNEFQATFTNNGDGSVSVVVPAKVDGSNWSSQLVQNSLTLTQGKWYRAKVTVSSDVQKNFQLLIQSDGGNGGNWDVINSDNKFSVPANGTYTYETVFQATAPTNPYIYGVMMGFVDSASPEARVKISNVSLKEYDAKPGKEESTSKQETTTQVTTTVAPTQAPTDEPTVAPTQAPTTVAPTETTKPSTGGQYAGLTYETASSANAPDIYYSVIENTLGCNVWYGDGGVTFQMAYNSNNNATNTTVKVNGVETTTGVVAVIGNGLLKLNPTLMDDNAYTLVEIQGATGNYKIVFKKGNPVDVPVETTTPEKETTTAEETTTKPEKPASTGVEIEGCQISTSIGGYRVVASVEPTINGKAVESRGIIYAVSKLNGSTDTGVTDANMLIDTENDYLTYSESTNAGIIDAKMGDSSTATYYAMTMRFGKMNRGAFVSEYKVRAYAKLADGTYVYSPVGTFTVFDITKVLYENMMMNSYDAHVYLYEKILTVVDKSYKEVEYQWNNTVVSPKSF